MKKTMTVLSLLAIAFSANAASINWAINAGVAGIYDYDGVTKLNAPIYLILTSDIATIDAAAVGGTFATALANATLGSDVLVNGKDTTPNTATSAMLTANVSYTYSVLIMSGDGQHYYTTAGLSELAYQAGVDDPKQVSFTTAQLKPATIPWQSTTPIPEPATAALALAGLAMLIRRRK